MESIGNVKRKAWATDPKFYTVLYRRKGSRRFYRCGYRSENLADIRDMAYDDIRKGRYAAAKIVDAQTEQLIEKVM